jgi:hypothetical protein
LHAALQKLASTSDDAFGTTNVSELLGGCRGFRKGLDAFLRINLHALLANLRSHQYRRHQARWELLKAIDKSGLSYAAVS